MQKILQNISKREEVGGREESFFFLKNKYHAGDVLEHERNSVIG